MSIYSLTFVYVCESYFICDFMETGTLNSSRSFRGPSGIAMDGHTLTVPVFMHH